MPKIVLAVTTAPSLGLAKGLPEYLVARGWQVLVVASPGDSLDALAGLPGVRTYPLPMARRPSLSEDLRGIAAWRALLRHEKPDVIFYGTPKVSLLASLAGLLVRQPHRIYILRGLRCEGARGLQRLLLRGIERLTFACSTEVISVSASLTRAAVRSNVVQRTPMRLFGKGSSNGVDTQEFSPVPRAEVEPLARELGLQAGVASIGFVGRINADKGVKDLLQAALLLVAAGHQFQLVLLGGNDGSDVGDLVQQVRAAHINVVMPGEVTMSKEHYALLDIMCLPTYREGFPNVVLEASACEVAVVTTEATGARDSVAPGVTGLRVPTRSPRHLASALERLLRNEAERREMGRAARTHVIENYSRETVQKNLVDYFDGLVSTSAPRR